MLQVRDLNKSFDGNIILKNLNFSILDMDKVAVVGLNGAGKSTLFRIVLNQISADSGDFFIGKSPRIGWMPQTVDELDLPNNVNVRDFLRSGRPLVEIEAGIAEVYSDMAAGNNSPELLERLGKLQSDFEYWDGYSADAELDTMIAQMNVDLENLNKNLGELSGGQKSKISFIRSLYSRPDILLLDEPTNHLDAASRDWMIEYLGAMSANVIFISHDEDFIRKIARKTLYIDAMTHGATLYNFGYDRFLRTLAETNISLEKQLQNQMREINRIQHFVDSMKGKSGKRKRQAQSREKALEKMKENLVAPRREKKDIDIKLKPNREGDANPVTAENLYFSYTPEKKVIKNLSFSLNRGEKFIVIGENGVGKSTLLKLIYNVLRPQAGNLKIGPKTDLGYYAQEYETLDKDISVLENASKSSNMSSTKIRALLGRFNFNGDKVKQSAATLSPGERSRLELAKLCMSGANTLLLDEPTNHLDVATRKSIAESFHEYGVTLVIVSHDVDFLKTLGVERMLMLPSGRVKFFDENIVRKYMELEKQKGQSS
ncbi:MAG: ATP-binding cassette domain-containing protein [Rickettsiales bacterium]|jgi:ATP-binding cassette subfamily F protein 3|nr:ATP-binding cassette domain-containing protein [Rickettsiales bacterium]